MSKQQALEEIMTPKIDEKGQVQLYEPGQVPPYWQDFANRSGVKILRLALTFGLIIPEYTMKDYILYAIESKSGYETVDIWGVQGSKKSCRTMIISHWCYGKDRKDYHAWDKVLNNMVLMPDAHEFPGYEARGFLQKMKSITKGEVVPLVAWDDITVNMPSSTFKTDIDVYGAVDAAWAAIRTKIKVMLLNNPLIDRLGRNIKDNITIECYIGRNQVEQVERCIRLPGLKTIESKFFKILVEPLHQFDYTYVPKSIFKEYFELRKEIADFAIQRMGKAFKDESALLEDMMTPVQIMNEISIAPSSLNDMIKRNFIPHEKINGKLYIPKKDFEDFKKCYLNNPRISSKAKQQQ